MESSPVLLLGLVPGGACSTLCVINGILTRDNDIGLIKPKVLNALRHQWNPHCLPWGRSPWAACAQRLAASMESSQPILVFFRCAFIVLNALRHQWNPHHFHP